MNEQWVKFSTFTYIVQIEWELIVYKLFNIDFKLFVIEQKVTDLKAVQNQSRFVFLLSLILIRFRKKNVGG
jgi:hypothetical protein